MYINDSLYLQATLMPDSEDGLRAHEPFIDGQKLCFAAYKTGGAQEGATAIYTYSDATHKWIPDGEPLGVIPDNSTVYRFVAYSHFGGTTTPSETDIDLSKDLVWGYDERKIEDTEVSRTVSINMLHKFAQVKVMVKSGITGVNITDLGDVEIEGGNWTAFDPFDGSFGTAGSVTQGVEFDTDLFPLAEIESEQRLVFPVAAARVKFGMMKISSAPSTTFSDKWTVFDSALDAGVSYTLVVTLKKGAGFAYSNIYWDGKKLTFDTTNKGNQGYQGVFFKFGSLVGISPARTNGSDDFSTSTPIYVPTYDKITSTNSTWTRKTGHSYTSTGWPITASGTAENGAANIPYLDGSYNSPGTVAFGRDNRLAIDDAQNTDTKYEGLRGDICQYLSTKTGVVAGDWRLPTSSDFGVATTTSWAASTPTVTPNADGWIKGMSSFPAENSVAAKEDGTANLLIPAKNGGNAVYGSAINRPLGDVVFPASGGRYYNGGKLDDVGISGLYWSGSGSTGNVENGHYLGFYDGSVRPSTLTTRSYAFPVRCIQN
jgi:hypothetical protein